MNRVDVLVLRYGSGGWLRLLTGTLAVAGAGAIFLSPANLSWKFCILAVLLVTSVTVYAADRKQGNSGCLALSADGSVESCCAGGYSSQWILHQNAWNSRWLCVLSLADPAGGRPTRCIVCASENRPDEYRRLRKYLNMRHPSPAGASIVWP